MIKKTIPYLFLLISSFSVLAQEKLTHEVYFETDDYHVLSTEENRLLLFISGLDGIDIEKISIYGFCDDRGSEHYNLALSQNRANAIKTVFSNNEIDESLISNVDGKGEVLLRIIKEDQVDKIRGLNRKVEIIATKKVPKPKKKL
ncbi:OmpA family protein [Lacinutrix himadriensis]|uniref:OmpA family protein n=1 Tax=Lacinutrix himadriensis TaxID=641549 RepID=UPI000B199400|nr:OmpA family protein [Lacinutrix himadriensis]